LRTLGKNYLKKITKETDIHPNDLPGIAIAKFVAPPHDLAVLRPVLVYDDTNVRRQQFTDGVQGKVVIFLVVQYSARRWILEHVDPALFSVAKERPVNHIGIVAHRGFLEVILI
jgi:hypothetical protein